jgi:hypothetical protein
MKLIVCFSTGDGYTYSSNHVIPVECESPEQLLVDIESEIMRAVVANKEMRDCYATNEKAEKAFSKKRGVTTEQVFEWRRHNPIPKFDTDVHLFEREWDVNHFYSSEMQQVYDIDISTLDEWFWENLVAVK